MLVRVCVNNTGWVDCMRENLFHFTSTGTVKATTKTSKDLDYSWVIIGFNSCKADREEHAIPHAIYMLLLGSWSSLHNIIYWKKSITSCDNNLKARQYSKTQAHYEILYHIMTHIRST